jgi:hypothetical protein
MSPLYSHDGSFKKGKAFACLFAQSASALGAEQVSL